MAVGAFVMPNSHIMPDLPLTAFSVPLEMLEDVAGEPLLLSPTQLCLTVLAVQGGSV